MKKTRNMMILAAMTMISLCSSSFAERDRLYSKTDPSDTGGIKGVVYNVKEPIAQVLAVPPDEPRLVYKGNVTGPGQRGFIFTNLPMRKYDLIIIYKGKFYEGLVLQKDPDTLTAVDKKQIKTVIDKCEPFFKAKVIHRLKGTTGRKNFSRCICTFVRHISNGKMTATVRRTFKIVILKQVGPGWQITRTRDLFPLGIDKKYTFPEHIYTSKLSKIRVTDKIKDIGEITLQKEKHPK